MATAPGYQGVATQAQIEAYIREQATLRGIDPNYAVRVYHGEGRSGYIGDQGKSFGPFQLYTGGGVGNRFIKDTGLDLTDPNTWREQVQYALNVAATEGWGQWYGRPGGADGPTHVGLENAHSVPLGPQGRGPGTAPVSPNTGALFANRNTGAPGSPPLPNLSPTSLAAVRQPVVEPVAGEEMPSAEEEPIVQGLAPASPTPLRVKVQKGDTLWDIAKDHLGDGNRWPEIAEANSIPKGAEKRLQVGTVLDVPGAVGPPTPQIRPVSPAVLQPASQAPVAREAGYGAPPDTAPSRGVPMQFPQPPVTEPDLTQAYGPEQGTQVGDRTMSQTTRSLDHGPPAAPVAQPAPSVTATPEPPLPPQSGGAVITDKNPSQTLATPEQMQTTFDAEQQRRLEEAQTRVPGVMDRLRDAFDYMMKDSIFVTGLIPEATRGITREPEPPVLDLTTPIRPPDYGLQPTTKDQSRITPDMPSQQRPGSQVAPPPATPVVGPRDTVSGAQAPARSAADFKPFRPDTFQRGTPVGVQNVNYGDVDGSPFVAYDQNGYHVVSTQAGGAVRTPLTQSSSGTTNREYYTSNGWQTTSGAPSASTVPTPPSRPTTSTGATTTTTAPSPKTTTTTTKPTTPSYATEPTRLTSGTGYTGGGGTLASI